MAAKEEQSKGSFLDTIKIAIALGLLVGGPVVLSIYKVTTSGIAKTGAIIGLVLAALVVFLTTAKGRASWEFMKDARIEVRKVIWPTQKETLQTTLIVIVMAVAVGLILFMFDGILAWLLAKFGTGKPS